MTKLPSYSVHVDDHENHKKLTNGLNEYLKNWRNYSDIVIVCIGTDRSSGDCLGPLVGDMISNKLKLITSYGTLENPVHALSLKDTLKKIEEEHEDPLVIAIDACLGDNEDIGSIKLRNNPIRPGAAVGKDLPPVGIHSIRGIVNIGGFAEAFVLQNTRLNLVMKMARVISELIIEADRKIYRNEQSRQRRSQAKLQEVI